MARRKPTFCVRERAMDEKRRKSSTISGLPRTNRPAHSNGKRQLSFTVDLGNAGMTRQKVLFEQLGCHVGDPADLAGGGNRYRQLASSSVNVC